MIVVECLLLFLIFLALVRINQNICLLAELLKRLHEK